MSVEESRIEVEPPQEAGSVKIEFTKEDFSFFTNFDIAMVRIIQRFYGNKIDPVVGDINCFPVQQLHFLLNKEGLTIPLEGVRRKLEFLVQIGFLEKVKTYPRLYMPIRDIDGIKKVQIKIAAFKKLFL